MDIFLDLASEEQPYMSVAEIGRSTMTSNSVSLALTGIGGCFGGVLTSLWGLVGASVASHDEDEGMGRTALLGFAIVNVVFAALGAILAVACGRRKRYEKPMYWLPPEAAMIHRRGR